MQDAVSLDFGSMSTTAVPVDSSIKNSLGGILQCSVLSAKVHEVEIG